jgi:hypothetical protein
MTYDDADKLIGRWTTDPNDKASLRESGRVSLVFENDGKLTYIIHGEKKDEVMALTYRVEGGMVITDQPSAPREEHTAFTLTPDGKLVLEFGGIRSHYMRDMRHS